MDVQRSWSDIYNTCDLAHDTRSHLGAAGSVYSVRITCVMHAYVKNVTKGSTYMHLDPVGTVQVGCRLRGAEETLTLR